MDGVNYSAPMVLSQSSTLLSTGQGIGNLYFDVSLMEEGMAYGGLPFLGTGCPLLDIGNICLKWKD